MDEKLKALIEGTQINLSDEQVKKLRESVFGIHQAISPSWTRPSFPKLPTIEERHTYESAKQLVEAIRAGVTAWHKQTAPDEQIVVFAILSNGISIKVERIRAATHHALWVDGTMTDGSPCFMTVHQNSLQILCFVERVDPAKKQNPIGFVIPEKQEDTE